MLDIVIMAPMKCGKDRMTEGESQKVQDQCGEERGGYSLVSCLFHTTWPVNTTIPSTPQIPQKGLTHPFNTICLHTDSDRSSVS